MFELNFTVVSLLFAMCGGTIYSLMTSCTGRNVEPWNTHMVAANIEIWLRSGVSGGGEGNVQSRLFHQHTGVFTQHFAYYNDERVDDQVNEFKPIEEFKNQNVDQKYGNDDDDMSYYDADYNYDYDNKYKDIDTNDNDDVNNDNDENNNDDYDKYNDDDTNDINDNHDDDGNIDDNNEYNNENDDDNKNDNEYEEEEDSTIQRVGKLIKNFKNNLFKQYIDHDEHKNVDADEQEEDMNIKYGLVDDCDYPYFNENDRSVVTIGQFLDGIPSGIVWQWRSRRFEDGFLYGQVNSEGRFTGDNITFIYPDLKTGIRGTFVNGKMVAGLEVKITGERCNEGIKELKIETVEKKKGIVWKRENLNATYIGKYPTVRDPLEQRNTYIEQSTIPGSDEGVFAKRAFRPGHLVMYFSGMKLQEEDLFTPEMTRAEQLVAGANYFGFSRTFPGFPKYLCIDQPPGYRHVKDYRTTLGHKVNHNFIGTNTKWGFVRHPSHGPVVSLIAIEPIAKGQELFVNYNYDLSIAPQWYVDHAREVTD